MKVIDLSHILETGMPVYPGTEQASLIKAASLDSDGFNEILLQFSSHTGTHIDCGRHFIRDGFDTGSASPERFYGKGLVIDCRKPYHQQVIGIAHLTPYERHLGETDFVLFHTGWSRYWGTEDYFRGFPVPDPEAARYLSGFQLKGIGTDAISFDPPESHDFPVHKLLLSHGIVLIENLTQLEDLQDTEFMFCCFPLKIKDGDGSPVRAVGIVGGRE